MANTTNSYTAVKIKELGPHNAIIKWNGDFCNEAALEFSSLLENLFGYFMYQSVLIEMESKGGHATALDFMLRTVDKWRQKGRSLLVSSAFECCSAAALFLSFSQWGHRKVDMATTLVFHGSRIDPRQIQELTVDTSKAAMRQMSDMDTRIIKKLVSTLASGAGSTLNLRNLIGQRVQFIDENWEGICSSMSSLTWSSEGAKRPPWIKAIKNLHTISENSQNFIDVFSQYLNRRFDADTRMDLREAFALCLVDEIDGVLDADMPIRTGYHQKNSVESDATYRQKNTALVSEVSVCRQR